MYRWMEGRKKKDTKTEGERKGGTDRKEIIKEIIQENC